MNHSIIQTFPQKNLTLFKHAILKPFSKHKRFQLMLNLGEVIHSKSPSLEFDSTFQLSSTLTMYQNDLQSFIKTPAESEPPKVQSGLTCLEKKKFYKWLKYTNKIETSDISNSWTHKWFFSHFSLWGIRILPCKPKN